MYGPVYVRPGVCTDLCTQSLSQLSLTADTDEQQQTDPNGEADTWLLLSVLPETDLVADTWLLLCVLPETDLVADTWLLLSVLPETDLVADIRLLLSVLPETDLVSDIRLLLSVLTETNLVADTWLFLSSPAVVVTLKSVFLEVRNVIGRSRCCRLVRPIMDPSLKRCTFGGRIVSVSLI